MTIKKFSIIFFSVSAVGLFSFFIYDHFNYKKQFFSWQINGRIQDIEYSEKGTPTIITNDKKYFLMYFWDRKIQIQIGDSIYKQSESWEVKVYNKDGIFKAVSH